MVTALELGLVPVPRLYGGGLYFPGSTAAAVLHRYRRWVRTVPDQMASAVALNRFPWQPDVPDHLRGRFMVHVRIAYHGTAADGQALVRPLREVAVPLHDTVADMPYRDIGSIHADPVQPLALSERSIFLHDLDEDAVDTLVDLAGPDSNCPLNFVELRHLGGALSRPAEPPNAVGGRDADFLLYAAASGPAADLQAVRGYARMLTGERMARWSTGRACVNFLGADDVTAAAVRAGYDDQGYRRLAAIKRNYDPENIFRLNHNIPPASAPSARSRRGAGGQWNPLTRTAITGLI